MGTKILQWNCNSISAHGGELKHYLTTMNFLPDIICLQETRLKPHHTFTLPGYNIIRRDRDPPDGGGGVMTQYIAVFHTVL